MRTAHIALVVLVLFPAILTAGLTWLAVRQAEDELAEFDGFEGMHFDK